MPRTSHIDGTPVARRTDPWTSHAAAASVNHLRESQQGVVQVFQHALQHGVEHLTDGQLLATYRHYEYEPPQSDSGLRTRRRELTDLGVLVDTGLTARSETGRSTKLWALAPNWRTRT